MLVFGTIAEDYRPTRTQREAAETDALDLGATLTSEPPQGGL